VLTQPDGGVQIDQLIPIYSLHWGSYDNMKKNFKPREEADAIPNSFSLVDLSCDPVYKAGVMVVGPIGMTCVKHNCDFPQSLPIS
jgi:hypothetical protein